MKLHVYISIEFYVITIDYCLSVEYYKLMGFFYTKME